MFENNFNRALQKYAEAEQRMAEVQSQMIDMMESMKGGNLKRWESVTIWLPRRINGRWYGPGSKVYRYYRLSPGGGYWTYGDDFDLLKDAK